MRNGVQARSPGAFEPRFRSAVPARIEGALAAAVIAAVLAIFYWLLVKLPGPLVVHVEDDTHQGVMNAKVVCEGPDGKRFSGLTDVFGEAKWPGLSQGAWRCEALPPPKFHTGPMIGYATVVPRKPAMWMARLERPATAVVQVVRPRGEPRAAPAVRALCQQAPGEDAPPTWESRAGLLDVYARVARTIRELAHKQGEPADGGLLIRERPTQQEIAGLIGTSRETVSRALNDFTRRGLLEMQGKQILVRWDFLRKVEDGT